MVDEKEVDEGMEEEETIQDEEVIDEEVENDTEPEPEPVVKPEPVVERRTMGMLADLQHTRKRAQSAEAKLEELQAQLERLKVGGDEASDEFVTAADVQAKIDAAIGKMRETSLDSLQLEAEARHGVEREGVGLDWQSAARAFEEMAEADPDMANYIFKKPNSPEALYQFVLKNHPDFIARVAARKNSGAGKRMSDLAKETTQRTAGGARPAGVPADLSQASDEELDRIIKQGK